MAAIVISEIAELRKKGQKNQQSRVERPITDRFVSWSCLGIMKNFIPETEGIKDSPGLVLRKRCGNRWRDQEIRYIKTVSLDL